MKYDDYIKRAYDIATRHGFHDKELPLEHFLMLTVTEVSEMVEADRKNKRAMVAMFKRECGTPQPEENHQKHWIFCFETFIKDSFEDEMADACIRLFDLAGTMGWTVDALDFSKLNENYLKKYTDKTVTQKAYELCQLLTEFNPSESTVELALAFLISWAKSEDIDIEWHIAQKMEYNDMRSRLHGKKY